MDEVTQLPADLIAPTADGTADHLHGMQLPDLALPSTKGRQVNLRRLRGWAVVFVYPRTAAPDEPPARLAAWSAIPGARGCTPQACGYRDLHQEFQRRAVQVFGLSVQAPAAQSEAAARLGLPYELLSDEHRALSGALKLPTLRFDGVEYLRRLTLFLHEGTIQGVHYPVFPPDRSAADAVAWLGSKHVGEEQRRAQT